MFKANSTTAGTFIAKYCLPKFRHAISVIIANLFFASAFLIQSCISCPDNKGNLVKVAFFEQDTNMRVEPYNRIYLQEKDTMLPFADAEIKLDVEKDHSTYILSNTTNNRKDTIVFNYKSGIEYLDRECGIQFEITDFHVNSSFREARIINVDEKINEWEIHFFR